MRLFLTTATLLTGLFFAITAQAQAPSSFSCTPEGFSLARTEEGYRLTGTLPTPNPGYVYSVGPAQDGGDGLYKAEISLIPPAGMVLMVLSTVVIDHTFGGMTDVKKLDIHFKKLFQWGAPGISCAALTHGQTEAP